MYPNLSTPTQNHQLKNKTHFRQYAYEALLEMALNFYGLESRWLDEEEKKRMQSSISFLSWKNGKILNEKKENFQLLQP